MRTVLFNFLCLVSIAFFFSSCEKTEMNDALTNENMNATKSSDFIEARRSFSDYSEMQAYMNNTAVQIADNKISESDYFKKSSSIVKDYLKHSPLAKVYNNEGEFQIGDTIYKLGKSGYTEFIIPLNRYEEAITILKNEHEIISNITSYKKNDDGLYILTDSVFMSYSDEPILQTQKIEPANLSISPRVVNFLVNVNFWSSSSFFFNGCGIEMSYQQLQNGNWSDYDTNLEMIWNNIVIVHKDKSEKVQLGRFINIGSGNKVDTGAYDKKTFDEKGGFNLGKFHYVLYRGVLTGKAKQSGGNWVSDTFIM